MAARNAERTIAWAVKSALLSLGPNDELLVMLDNCSDRTGEMVRRINDRRLRVYSSKTTLGVAGARNELVRLSKMTHIAVLDADDIALPWRFNVTRRLLREFDIVFGSAIVFGRGLGPLGFIPQIPRRIVSDPLEVLFRNPFVHSSSAFPRRLMLEVGGYPETVSEDYGLWTTFLAEGATYIRTALHLVLYRVHPSQYSAQEGFFDRVENDALLAKSRERLLKRLGMAQSDLRDCQRLAREAVLSKGFLAKLEVFGLRKWPRT